MIKLAATIGAAVLCAGLLTVLPTPDVAAGTPTAQSTAVRGESMTEQSAGKADRLDMRPRATAAPSAPGPTTRRIA